MRIERENYMININRVAVDNLSKQPNSKNTSGTQDTSLYPIYIHSLTNLSDLTRNYSTYEMAHWTNYADRFCDSKISTTPNTTGYKRGSIVFVDLGAGNFGHEPSYTHPAVVLQQNKYSIMVAPCSSKKYNKGISSIIDATTSDGFSINTGIQTDSIRWISKDRVISTHGTVSNSILDAIDKVLLNIIPTYKREIRNKDTIISQLESEKATLESENISLKEELEKLKTKISELSVSNSTNEE